ncbi:MAG TPA: FliA/WhiG family RNA polymerase sigma factor [Candidatus Acidoferrales bacterium]|nr:FliA/WhiG family RNA polymerase sigma factor [Candidatus Acidoferrales bacterium]
MAELREGLCGALSLNEAQRERLLLDHLPHVHHIARRIHYRLPPQVPLEDLIHAGILGLLDALRRFDPNKNVRLKHYAEFRIRGAILDSLRDVDWSPRALRRKARWLEQAISKCQSRLGRDPAESEIACELGMKLDDLQRLRTDLRGLSLSTIPAEETSALSHERPNAINGATGGNDDPYQIALRAEMAGLLTRAMAELSHRERDVLVRYHFGDLSMKAIGTALGIGESRVSQIRTAALSRLRSALQKLMMQRPPSQSNQNPGPH